MKTKIFISGIETDEQIEQEVKISDETNVFFYPSPFGEMMIAEKNQKIIMLLFKEAKHKLMYSIKETSLIKEANNQLQEYFLGKRREFDLPLAPIGTPFQQSVWKSLMKIPYGETRSYKDIAVDIGNAKASRAVGLANNRNKIAIIIPCHRVVGFNGKLVGYGYGLEMKERLLELEKKNK